MIHLTLPARAAFALFLVFPAASYTALSAQNNASPAPAPAARPPAYPDSAGGLDKMARDIFRAIKDGDTGAYGSLISSLAQPVPEDWYDDVFGPASDTLFANYSQYRPGLEHDLNEFFLKMRDLKATSLRARKHEATCDDNAGELAYPLMDLRQKPVPLYELRFFEGERFYRLWVLAYVDGGFRFLGHLQAPESFVPARRKANSAGQAKGTASNTEPIQRIRVGGNMASTRIVRRIQPEYPSIAREERLQGTVKLHAIIAKDGTVQHLRVVKGYCSLSDAAVKAVRQWRYSPTLLNGEPVEVDTTIEVVFQLNR